MYVSIAQLSVKPHHDTATTPLRRQCTKRMEEESVASRLIFPPPRSEGGLYCFTMGEESDATKLSRLFSSRMREVQWEERASRSYRLLVGLGFARGAADEVAIDPEQRPFHAH